MDLGAAVADRRQELVDLVDRLQEGDLGVKCEPKPSRTSSVGPIWRGDACQGGDPQVAGESSTRGFAQGFVVLADTDHDGRAKLSRSTPGGAPGLPPQATASRSTSSMKPCGSLPRGRCPRRSRWSPGCTSAPRIPGAIVAVGRRQQPLSSRLTTRSGPLDLLLGVEGAGRPRSGLRLERFHSSRSLNCSSLKPMQSWRRARAPGRGTGAHGVLLPVLKARTTARGLAQPLTMACSGCCPSPAHAAQALLEEGHAVQAHGEF